MPKYLIGLVITAALATAPALAANEPTPADQTAIAANGQGFDVAWNAHDAHALAMLFAPDADFTNILGQHAHGRAAVEAFHAPNFAGVFKTSRLASRTRSIRMLTPGLAVVDTDWSMTGVRLPDGTAIPERTGLGDLIMARQPDGAWLILVMHNAEFNRFTPPPAKP
jgi:uncharacterized protein (TIGR02246 family)